MPKKSVSHDFPFQIPVHNLLHSWQGFFGENLSYVREFVLGDTVKKKQAGIYQIRNLVNGKIYIGSSISLPERWAEHKRTLRRTCHRNIYLQRSWDKYGEDAFIFEVLEIVTDVSNLIKLEQLYLDTHSPDYNMAKCATAPMQGRNHTEETKHKIASAQSGDKGYWWGKSVSDERKQKISKKVAGKNHPNFGKKFSKERRKKMSEVVSGDKHPNWGKHLSESTKRRIALSHQGEKSCNSKLTDESVRDIRRMWKTGKYTQTEIGRFHGVAQMTVSDVVRYATWKHME